MKPEQLQTLQASWQSKHDEATALIAKEDATGEDLTKAEKLFDERDALGKQITDEGERRKAEQERTTKLKSRADEGRKFASEPIGNLLNPKPKGSDDGTQFKLAGFEQAGHLRLDTETQRIVEEVGPGTFGEKTWELMQTLEYKRDFVLYCRKGVRQLDRSVKTLQEGLDDQGGVFAPADLIMRVVGREPAPTSLRSKVTTITTGRDIVKMPRTQYSSDDKYSTAFRSTWTGEIPASDTAHLVNDANLLGEVEIPVHTAMLSAPVTANMAEDAAFNFMTWLETKLNEVIDLLYEDMILNGTGVGQPFGIYSNIGAADRPEVVLSGAAAALAYDGIVDLWTALAPQYDNNATFVMNKKSAFRALCKLKDGANRPIYNRGEQDSGLASPRQRSIEGYPIVFSQFTQDVGASGYPLIFGDLRGYFLAQRIGFSIRALDQVLARQNQILLLGRCRFGGKPVEHWRLKLQKSNNA